MTVARSGLFARLGVRPLPPQAMGVQSDAKLVAACVIQALPLRICYNVVIRQFAEQTDVATGVGFQKAAKDCTQPAIMYVMYRQWALPVNLFNHLVEGDF
jgi:hypothetical protein